MASEIDKFVLQYQVELRDSITRLEELKKKMEEIPKAAKKTEEGLLNAFKEINPTIGKTIDFVTKAGSKFGTLIVTFSVLTAAIKAADFAMREFNERQKVAYQTGMGTIGITNFERNMREASGGRVNRAGSREALGTVSNLVMQAYSDPTKMGDAARKLQMAGVSSVGKGGGIADTSDVMSQLSKNMAAVTREQAVAMGQLLGITPQATDALRQLAGETAKTTNMTADEALHKKAAAAASVELQGAYNEMSENWKDFVQVIGDDLLPSIASLMKAVAGITKGLFEGARAITDWGDWVGRFLGELFTRLPELLKGKSPREIIAEATKAARAPSVKQSEQEEGQHYKETHKQLAQETLNMNTFSNAVNKFSSSVDQSQAMAAWAGNVGRAMGLQGASSNPQLAPGQVVGGASVGFNAAAMAGAQGSPMPAGSASAPVAGGGVTVSTGVPSSTTQQTGKYDDVIREASKKYGVPEDLIRGIISVESHGNRMAHNASGATGLMQVMPSNYKWTGITDPTDPRQAIMGGTQVFAYMLKRAGGNKELALRYYNGGFNQKAWGAQNAAYAGKVMSAAGMASAPTAAGAPVAANAPSNMPAPMQDALSADAAPTFSFSGPAMNFGLGQSQESMNYSLFKGQLAQAGNFKSIDQLNRGQYTKGDVAWAGSQMYSNLLKERYSIIQQLRNPNVFPRQKQGLANNLRSYDQQIANVQNFMPTVMAQAREGGRQVTRGDMRVPVNINIIGGADSKELAKHVQKELQGTLNDLVNEYSTGGNA